MHEAKLCISLIDMAKASLEREGAGRILSLRIEVGALSGVASEALAAAFPVCAAGTPAEGAALHIQHVPGRELLLRDMEVV